MSLFAFLTLYHYENGRLVLHAMPLMILVLCCLAVAYRYYSAFLAAKVAALDDSRITPAHRFNDGQNYHPTNRWVLFGHHFAAISGAGPLIGPVLAIQYGYAPGLLWLVIGVCLAGAVQDMLVLAASVRTDGKSLAEIARQQLGPAAAIVASLAILFIVVIALAGLGFVVVKALGGEEVRLPAGMEIIIPEAKSPRLITPHEDGSAGIYELPPGCVVRYAPDQPSSKRHEAFRIKIPKSQTADSDIHRLTQSLHPESTAHCVKLPSGCAQVVPGSSWGTFTIAMTIPIALLVGLWMYRIRPGKVLEASILGGILVLMATILGNWIPGSPLEPYFSLTKTQTVWALAIYGFVAAILPVWLLLGPRDYLSSFLKIGTIALLVMSVIVANPTLHAPPINDVFLNGGPTFPGQIFPFVFICIMCGAISGFHSLVSSGTTPKMVDKESHVRMIGYGSMLIEGLVGVVALIAAASLPSDLYYDINISIDRTPQFQAQLQEVNTKYGRDPLHAVGVESVQHLNLGAVEERVGGESLRGRTGGAVTLAVGMSVIFEQAFQTINITGEWLLKYWYHFAIMFEALFILTTIDAGTRIARFLVQETAGRIYKPFGRPDWLPGAILASAIVTAAWGFLIATGSIVTIWTMFGIANQILAVLALCLVTTWLINSGRARYAPVTLLPMLFVSTTTLTAAVKMVGGWFPRDIALGRQMIAQGLLKEGNEKVLSGYLNSGLAVFVVLCVLTILVWAIAQWIVTLRRELSQA